MNGLLLLFSVLSLQKYVSSNHTAISGEIVVALLLMSEERTLAAKILRCHQLKESKV